MLVNDFLFNIPKFLIAQYPLINRSKCRLLYLDGTTGNIQHGIFTDILNYINSGDLLVLNDTRVIPARIYGHKITGGKIEILVARIINRNILAKVYTSKPPKINTLLLLGNQEKIYAKIIANHNGLFEISFLSKLSVLNILNYIGNIPIPPYLNRSAEDIDYEFYQTIYGINLGSVATPTAGLHFDHNLIENLKNKGVKIVFITLHIGIGTFQPVHTKMIENHSMHAEYAQVTPQVVDEVLSCKDRGNKVIAVGTSCVRALESAVKKKNMAPFLNYTDLFIYPGYNYRIVDAMITNFHFPKSTLLMLVAAFAGYERIMHAYQEAIYKKYSFFSYGDAMFITK